MELTLTRHAFKETYTIGKLTLDGKFLCDTLEDKVRILEDKNKDGDFDDEGEGKIYGQTAIPEGRYEIALTYWVRKKRYVPRLKDVPGFQGILIHAGNTAEDTHGCILVGENTEVGRLLNSRLHENNIMKLIRHAIRDLKEKVFITIQKQIK